MKHPARLLLLGLLTSCRAPTAAPAVPPPATDDHARISAPAEPAAACPAITLPDTPAGRRLDQILEVFAHGGPERLEALVTNDFAPSFRDVVPMPVHLEILQEIQAFGPAHVCRVEFDAPATAMVLVGAQRGSDLGYLTVHIEPEPPHRFTGLTTHGAGPEALSPPAPLDDATRHAVIEGVCEALDDYVFADVAAAMQAHLRAERDAGRYAALEHRALLAQRLTEDLRRVSHDLHLHIVHSQSELPEHEPEPTDDDRAAQRERARAEGYGIASATVLPGNIGYVDIRAFFSPDLVREAVAEAMTTVAGTNALIVDLRHNHGGDPATVALVTSYLFGDERVHLNDLYYRARDETTEYWTDPGVAGERFGPDKPVVVLTSAHTFSGGEEFAYNLRTLERATLVGEITGGGAHPVDGVRVDAHTLAMVPVGRAINPITKTNWEGKGVEPHIAVPAAEALDRARALIEHER